MHNLCFLCHSLGILFHNFQCYFRMGANVYLPQVSPFQISHIPNPPATEYFVDFSSRLWFPSTWPVLSRVLHHSATRCTLFSTFLRRLTAHDNEIRANCTLPPPLQTPTPCNPPPPGDRHFHVFLVNMYCAGLCCPSALRMALHCFPITSNQAPVCVL